MMEMSKLKKQVSKSKFAKIQELMDASPKEIADNTKPKKTKKDC